MRPAVYHCAAGKDRTGVVSAILLGVLGVPDEIIVADYAATQENLDAIIERLMSTEGYQTHAERPAARHPARRARDDARASSSACAARYGSMAEYARSAGVAEDALDRLRTRLLA